MTIDDSAYEYAPREWVAAAICNDALLYMHTIEMS